MIKVNIEEDNIDEQIDFNEERDFKINLDYIENQYKKRQISKLIDKYRQIFAKVKFDVGIVKAREAEIKLIKDEYVTSRAYKCSIPDEKEIKEQIKKLLEADLIEESDSPFLSPVTLAYKKDDGRKYS